MVLFLLSSLTELGGGIELHDRQVLESFHRLRPHEPLAIVLAREHLLAKPALLSASLRGQLTTYGTKTRQRALRIAEFSARATAVALSRRPRLIVCGHMNFAPLAALLARTLRVPFVLMVHGIEAWRAHSRLSRWALERAHIIAVSKFTADQILEHHAIAPTQVHVVPNIVDGARFSPGTASAALTKKVAHVPRPRLLSVGRFDSAEAYKGVDTVLHALARLRPQRPVGYIVVGTGSDVPRLQSLARELDVPVHFFGRATDAELVDLYRESDLFVLPSRGEGFGYVFVEALATGLPVIAGNADGSTEALAHGALGVMVDPTDPAALAAAIDAHFAGTSPPQLRDSSYLRRTTVERFSQGALDGQLDIILRGLGL